MSNDLLENYGTPTGSRVKTGYKTQCFYSFVYYSITCISFNKHITSSCYMPKTVCVSDWGGGIKGYKRVSSIDMCAPNIYCILHIFIVHLLPGDRQSQGIQT